ncbi:MAG: hypothetical protein PHO41_11550 [Eubacteriales bacterium]|nr:hypothetical protein [Eubacteriales bacterium]
MPQAQYSMPDGCIYYLVPDSLHTADTVISLRHDQAVLLRTRSNTPVRHSVVGDYTLRQLLPSARKKVQCEIEFISLRSYKHTWGGRITLWDGSSAGLNGSMYISGNEAKAEVFAALLRDLRSGEQQLPPEAVWKSISKKAFYLLETQLQQLARQHAYGAADLISHQAELAAQINAQLPTAIVDGIKMVEPIIIAGIIP